MSNISDLLKYSQAEPIPIPTPQNIDGVSSNSRNVRDKYINSNSVGLPENVDENGIVRAWQSIGQVLGKYSQVRNNPGVGLEILNSILGTNIMSATPEVPLPKWITSEDKNLLGQASNILGMGANIASGFVDGGRRRTQYELIVKALGLTDSLDDSSLAGSAASTATGMLAKEALKYEFEYSRIPWRMPGHKASENLSGVFEGQEISSSNLEAAAGNAANNLLGIDAGVGTVKPSMMLSKTAVNRVGLGYENSNLKDSYSKKKYSAGRANIQSYLDALSNEGLLSGYNNYLGFEIGSDHDWIVQIFPYPHDTVDIKLFEVLKRPSLTPPLPYYLVPNFWLNYESPATNGGGGNSLWNAVGNAVNSIAGTVVENITGQNDKDISSNQLGTNAFATSSEARQAYQELNNFKLVDFSEFCPVISYDLNYGNPKTESVPLFNGASFDTIVGFQYNITMNVSIIDDMYGSMRKYMNYYINSIYDYANNCIAPYYAMAFDIRLYIFRSGKQIKDALKLIGIPIDYSPRLSGSDAPNESRVDITFSIIGADRVDPGNTLGGAISGSELVVPEGAEIAQDREYLTTGDTRHGPLSTLTWDKIILDPK